MIISKLHTSLEEPPSTSMFHRAGNAVSKKAKTDKAEALTQVADKITGALSLTLSIRALVSLSPAKVIENPLKMLQTTIRAL